MKKILAMVGAVGLSAGIALISAMPASAAGGCQRLDTEVWASNYAATMDLNNGCGMLGANTYFSPNPGIEHYSGWQYSTTNYVESKHLATMIRGYHSGS